MVRDLESLIEWVYLKSTNSDLLSKKNVLVNPVSTDVVIGKICIINKHYSVPDLTYADQVIDRNIRKYKESRNNLFEFVNIEDPSIFIVSRNNKFYFGIIPKNLDIEGPCIDYLRLQHDMYSHKLEVPLQRSF